MNNLHLLMPLVIFLMHMAIQPMSQTEATTYGFSAGFRYQDYTYGIRTRPAQNLYEATTGIIPLMHTEVVVFDHGVVLHSDVGAVLSAAKTIVTTLHKCANKEATREDFLALSYAAFAECVYLNEYLQAIKSDIHKVGYVPQPDGTEKFVGVRTVEEVTKIQQKIDSFEQVIHEWVQSQSLITKNVALSSNTTVVSNDIESTSKQLSQFYQHLFEVENLCKCKQFDKALEIRDMYSSFTDHEDLTYKRYEFLSHIINGAQTTYKKELQVQVAKMEILSKSPDVFKIHTNQQQVAARMQALQETLATPKFETKTYTLTEGGQALLQEFMVDQELFIQCYGNQLDQQLHSELVSVVNNAAVLYYQCNDAKVSEMVANTMSFAKIGGKCLRWGLSYQALIVVDLCMSFYECGQALKAGALKRGSSSELKHVLAVSIYKASSNLSKVIDYLKLNLTK